MVKRLLIANVAVFFVTYVLGPQGQRFVFEWFAFQPTLELLSRPWVPVTYMFLHAGLMHLLVNMLILFFFGPPLEERWGGREFLTYYIICGLGGAALSFIFQPVSIVGASGALLGVMLAFAMNWPNAPIYVWGIFPIKAKYLVGFFVIMDILGARSGVEGGSVAHFAHLGGVLTGFLYLKADWRPREKLRQFQRAAWRGRRLAIVPRDENGDELPGEASSGKSGRDEAALYDRVDEVLDKISAEGMSALTPAELKLLDEVSKRHRSN
ncbi:MAG: rhomboid family intramembrane serine protease [Gemmatimonadota bacterium]|nr:rhomboid family intramembrane serine protease [Gemmatimonadota bacterium]